MATTLTHRGSKASDTFANTDLTSNALQTDFTEAQSVADSDEQYLVRPA